MRKKERISNKKGRIKNFYKCLTLALVFITVGILFTSCGTDASQTKTEYDYPVEGIWHTHANWEKEFGYNVISTFDLDIYFNFIKGGVVKVKTVLARNGVAMNDDDWAIADYTWSVEGNVIFLSTGKQYIIYDDEFNDIWPDPWLVLHFRKEQVN